MLSSLGCLLLCGSIALALGNAQKLPKGKRPNMKVHINTTSDSIFLKFLRPSPNIKLEGFLLGYGSNLSPNQYFPLPAEGKYTEAVVDAEPKYLIVVRPAPLPSKKKSCSGKTRPRKPLQLVVGTLTPSSVFLSWGFLINPQHDWTLPTHCPNDRFYTIRYREKDKEKKWIFQLCPATETIVENLKPNTVYEFGVKDNVEGGIWSKIFNHKTNVGSINKVNGKIQSTSDQVHTVPAYVPRKVIPITIIKQVIQNVTHRASTKSPDKTPIGGTILLHLVIPGLNETTVKLPTSIMFEISDAIKRQLAKNETLALPAESKTPKVEKIPAQPITVTPESVPRTTKPTVSSVLDISERKLASSEKPWILPTAKISEDSKVLPPQTATYDVFSSPATSDEPEISEAHPATSDPFLDSVPPKTSRTLEQPRATLAPSETPFVPQKLDVITSPEMQPTTPAPLQTTSIPSTPKRRLKPKTQRTKPERTKSPGTTTSKIFKSPEPAWTTLAPSKTQFISLKPKVPLRPEVTHLQPAPKQTPRTPSKPKTSPRPRVPQTQPVPKVSQRVTSKPKMSPRPEVPYTLPVPRDVLLPHKPDSEVSQSEPVLQPVTFRIDLPQTTIAPLETRGSPLIPMISPSPVQEELQTTLAETDQFTQEPFTTEIPQTTELAKTTQAPHRLYTAPVRPRIPDKAHIQPVLNKTTTRPSRPKPSGTPRENGMGTGVKQALKPSSAGGNVSVDSTHSTKKTATTPGTRRPPLAPRPTPPRRKPLPPNNVTGKPGSAGIIASGRVTSPPLRTTFRPTGAPSERTEIDKRQPTAPASGEYLGNVTDFSSSPTRETDHLGKPRFKGPHVRYIQKPDNRPCSITDSVKRFPVEEASEGNATSPPQNPPSNLTVVTVEGCPSFVILDWEKPPNDTVTEYEVISRENGSFSGKNKSVQVTNQTFSTVENLKPDTSYEFQVKPKNPLGEGPASNTVAFSTESADPRVSEPVSGGRDAIWTERPFNSDSYSECKGKQYVKRTWYKKFVGVQLCNSLRYKIYLSDSLTGKFYNIGDQRGHGEDHCQFVDSFLDGRTGQQLTSDQLPTKKGYFRAVRQEPVQFGEIGGHTQINYVQWYECGTTIPGKW
ncbi:target of Nesh-SH3 isoform X11 [Rousettus aegyptiacus]|uniref:target of Nesh-SH3 isoform X11 n=1 Tax=Rousettus aegyptiacus TaxID=9407 RepID=UPI00168CFBE5|nr:target of Nesh-SH3 isoform X11 [Rousettus aegyptiacus]